MDKNHRELVQRLFALATEILEDTVEAAVAGQSNKRSRTQCVRYAREISAAGGDLISIAHAIDTTTLCGGRAKTRSNRRLSAKAIQTWPEMSTGGENERSGRRNR